MDVGHIQNKDPIKTRCIICKTLSFSHAQRMPELWVASGAEIGRKVSLCHDLEKSAWREQCERILTINKIRYLKLHLSESNI